MMTKRFVLVLLAFAVACEAPRDEESTASAEAPHGMVLVSGGEFTMGTDSSEWAALDSAGVRQWAVESELPAHVVTVRDFLLDSTEVTNAEFARFVAATPAWRRDSLPAERHNGRYLEHWATATGSDSASAHEPVRFITWQAAQAFCAWRDARLPTEAEWEYAARAGAAGDVYPWGAGAPDSARARYGAETPVVVATYPANANGLYDLAGNVWEFVDDVWRDTYADSVPAARQDSAAAPASNVRRVIRGGSYEGAPVNMRVRFRDSHPSLNAGPHVGFRCARDAV